MTEEQKQDERKYCPMPAPEYSVVYCAKDKCAWWVDDECAIVAIGRQINYLGARRE